MGMAGSYRHGATFERWTSSTELDDFGHPESQGWETFFSAMVSLRAQPGRERI